jgi:predicted dehydrogenase
MQEAHVWEDIMQLVDWIREDKPTVVSAEHARHVIEIFDAAYRSAQTGQAQVLRTSFETIS